MSINKFRILVYLPCTVLLSLLPPVCVQCALRSVDVSTKFHEFFNILRKWVFKHDESIWSQDVCQVYSSTIFVFHHPSVKISPEKCPHFRQTHHIQKGKGAENIFDNCREISLLPLLVVCSACVTRGRWMEQCLQCVPGWPHVHIFTICRACNLLCCGRHSRLGR